MPAAPRIEKKDGRQNMVVRSLLCHYLLSFEPWGRWVLDLPNLSFLLYKMRVFIEICYVRGERTGNFLCSLLVEPFLRQNLIRNPKPKSRVKSSLSEWVVGARNRSQPLHLYQQAGSRWGSWSQNQLIWVILTLLCHPGFLNQWINVPGS